jgi:hypothetical protein
MSELVGDGASLPPLGVIKTGLQSTTEALANELAHPNGQTPKWSEFEWRLACAVATAHGVSGLLSTYPRWQNPAWMRFLQQQHEQVALRHQRVAALLERIDEAARQAGIALVALKGSTLHALGIYAPGERPMADIDLLVSDDDAHAAGELLETFGYALAFANWKHRAYKPVDGMSPVGLGEHRDTPVNIELHTRIQERLPVATVDITARIYPATPAPGVHLYPSLGALMSHLLLHAAGNICNRTVRLIQLHDIAVLASRMSRSDWRELWSAEAGAPPWWALPPLQLVARYYNGAVPQALLYDLQLHCHPLLRAVTRRHTLTRVSCSQLWLQALPGIEWARSMRELGQYLLHRVRPTPDAKQERHDMVRTQAWLQEAPWVKARQLRRVFTWLLRPVPRMDTLYVVRAALGQPSPSRAQRVGPAVST